MAKKKRNKKYKKRKYHRRKKIRISKKIWSLCLIPILLLVLLIYLVYEDNKDIGKEKTKHFYLTNVEKDTVKIYFVDNDGTTINTLDVEKNTIIEAPPIPTKSGYQFVEWQEDGVKFDFTQPITQNITLAAKWKNLNKKEFTVTFDSTGGTKISSQIIEEGSKATKPSIPKKDGYKFVEWQLNGKKYNFDNLVKKDITLIAIWKTTEEEITDTEEPGSIDNVEEQTEIEDDNIIDGELTELDNSESEEIEDETIED
jgi:uncharacterized repeat protein (TIGR02543 family)